MLPSQAKRSGGLVDWKSSFFLFNTLPYHRAYVIMYQLTNDHWNMTNNNVYNTSSNSLKSHFAGRIKITNFTDEFSSMYMSQWECWLIFRQKNDENVTFNIKNSENYCEKKKSSLNFSKLWVGLGKTTQHFFLRPHTNWSAFCDLK